MESYSVDLTVVAKAKMWADYWAAHWAASKMRVDEMDAQLVVHWVASKATTMVGRWECPLWDLN